MLVPSLGVDLWSKKQSNCRCHLCSRTQITTCRGSTSFWYSLKQYNDTGLLAGSTSIP